MKEIILIVRPEKLEVVKNILDDIGLSGMTISSVMGCGTQRGAVGEAGVNQIKGFKTTINLLPKIQISAVVPDEKIEEIIAEVRSKVPTGRAGDGKIFIRNMEDAMRIRTGERGNKAL
ncbi:MAG: P-II family nitrogen regulator [Lachnospirales bacterium]